MILPNAPRLDRRFLVGLLVLLVCTATGWAFRVKERLGPLDDLVFTSPQLRVTATPAEAMPSPVPLPNIGAIQAMLAELGPKWTLFMDLRTGRPTLIDGGAIPWIPGPANALGWDSFGTDCRENACIPVEVVEAMARQFLARYPGVFMLEGYDLVLDRNGSGPVWNSIYFLRFQPYYKGVILKGASIHFRINNGNLIQVAVSHVGNVGADAMPVVGLNGAWQIMYEYIGGAGDDTVVNSGRLEYVPVTPKGLDPEVFSGAAGSMRDYALAWRLSFQRKGVIGTWEGLVDAHTGDLLAFVDARRYGHIHGGVRLTDGLPPEENLPFPYADVQTACTEPFSDANGNFAGNTATSTLCGKYARVYDGCGPISNTTTTGDLDFLVDNNPGTDCVVPPGNPAGLGNTHSARTQFYNLTAVNLRAQVYNPGNTWLTGSRTTCYLNGPPWCGATSDPDTLTINFYKAVPPMCNLGELPGIGMHLWAHFYDSNDGSGGQCPPEETYADWTATLQSHSSCMGDGAYGPELCFGYGDACTSCTGVRDCDWDKHASHTPWTYLNHTTGTPVPPATIWSCGPGGYNGPCGWEDHCESGISTQALWDFVSRDLPAECGMDLITAWMLEDRLWFSGVQTLDAMYTCSGGVTDGCTGDVLYNVMRALDDTGDGTANGTPHAHAIYHALHRHLIDCSTYTDTSPQNQNQTSCPFLNTPTLSAVAGNEQAVLNWTSGGADATRYFIFRNESNCTWGFNRIAVVNAPTQAYTDNGAINGMTYYYRVQAATNSDACTSACGNCVSLTPQPNAGPVISNVQVTNITDSSAAITWTTDVPANSRITYGTSIPPGTNQDDLTAYVTSHSLTLTGLTQCTTYYFSVTSADALGNSTTDTNGGAYYAFTTYGLFVAFADNMESGTNGWTWGGLWHQVNEPDCSPSASSPTHSWYYGQDSTCNYDTGGTTSGRLVSPAILALPSGAGLTFKFRKVTENSCGSYDRAFIQISTNGGSGWTTLGEICTESNTWINSPVYDLAPYAGADVLLGFFFNSVDGSANAYLGWMVDDVQVTAITPCAPTLEYQSNTFTDACNGTGSGNNDGVLDAGEDITVHPMLKNTGTLAATGISATLGTSTPGVTVTGAAASYPDLAPGASAPCNAPHFTFRVGTGVACGTTINFTLNITSAQGTWTEGFTMTVGNMVPGGPVTAFSESFTSVAPPNLPAGWTRSKTSGSDWQTTAPYYCAAANGLYYPYHESQAADSWIYAPGLLLTAGVVYTLNFNQKVYSFSYPEMFEVKCGTAATPAGQTITILPPASYTNQTCTQRSPSFTVSISGTYYISWHCMSAANMWFLIVDDILLTYPGPPTCSMNSCTPTVTAPKPVPDGRLSGTAQRAGKITSDGTNLTLTYDASTCTQADHSILYGLLTALNPITPFGGVCSIGNTSPYAWNASPAGNIWWVIVGDGGTTESSWGQKMVGGVYSERSAAASNQCGNAAIDVTGTCP